MTGGALGISPLNAFSFGAGSAYGDYSSYLPSMYGMSGMSGLTGLNGGMNSIFGANGLGMGMGMGTGFGMNSLLEYQMYMNQMQNKIQEMQLDHNAVMHHGMVRNEVKAHDDSLSGIIQKLMADGDVQQRIYSLNRKIKEGDQDGVCEEYDKLKSRVYHEFATEFKNKGTAGHRSDNANQIISVIYGNLVSAREGGTHELYQDIKKYGDGAFANGFFQGFRGDHHKKFVDETLNHIYGERIDHRSEKDFRQNLGKGLGNTAGVIEHGVLGAGLTTGAWLLGAGILAPTVNMFLKKDPATGIKPKSGIFTGAIKHSWKVALGALVLTMLVDAGRRIAHIDRKYSNNKED